MQYKKDDIFVRLIDSSLSEDDFLELKKSHRETSDETLEIDDCKFKLSLSFITIDKNKLIEKDKFEQLTEQDELDLKLFGKNSPFLRSTYISKKTIKFVISGNSDNKTIFLKLYINESKLTEIDNLHIFTYTLTNYLSEEYVLLSNKELILLSNYCANFFKNGDLKDIFTVEEIIVKEENLNAVDGVGRFIQFICDDGYNTTNDVREIITKHIKNQKLNNLYYFFSILTNDYTEGLYRRHLNNIKSVMEYCHSISESYLNVISGNICLEITNKPIKKSFEQVGHDSDEFRIWELLLIQKHILDGKKYIKKLDKLEELNYFYNYRMFTKKLEKGNNWMSYANYLKDITRVEYLYNIRKNELLLEEREEDNKLKKLNHLIIVSIFISVVTFLLSPLYSNISYATSESLTYNYFINNGLDPETTAIMLGVIISIICYHSVKSRKECKEDLNKLKNKISSKWIFILFMAIILLIIIKYPDFIYKIIQGIS